MKCKTCIHWKNQQRDLNYHNSIGICINPNFKFNTRVGRLVGVLDQHNLVDRVKVAGNPSHDIETEQGISVSPSRYQLVTEEEFGCIYYEPIKTKNHEKEINT